MTEHDTNCCGQCDPKDTNLLLMEKPNCPKELQKNCDEMVFEQFEFASYYRCVGTITRMSRLRTLADRFRSDTKRLPSRRPLTPTLLPPARMPPHNRHILLGHNNPPTLRRPTSSTSSSTPHSRRQAAHKLPQRTIISTPLQHDGRNISLERNQGSCMLRRTLDSAVFEGPGAHLEGKDGR